MDIKQLIENSKLKIDSSKIYYDEPMSKHTTFKIGGPAECYIKIHNIEDLQEALEFSEKNKIKITILGNGSNVLVTDNGIKGIVLKIDLKDIKITNNEQKEKIIVESGYKMAMLAQTLLQNEISGFEELAGIPGTIGGAVVMNAGAYGKEMKDIVTNVKAIDYKGNIFDFTNKESEFDYRKSKFSSGEFIILEATLELQKGKKDEIKEKMNQYSQSRKEKQPIEYPSAGSTFKRGTDFITAKLIDEAGLKGYKIGGAEISEKHSGFIINKNNATAKDVIELANYVSKTLKEKFRKEVKLEIKIIGE